MGGFFWFFLKIGGVGGGSLFAPFSSRSVVAATTAVDPPTPLSRLAHLHLALRTWPDIATASNGAPTPRLAPTSPSQFMVERLGFDLSQAGFLFALPYLGMILGELCASNAADSLIASKRLSLRSVRTIFTLVGGLGSSAFLFIITQDISVAATIVMFCVSLFIFAIGAGPGSYMVGNDLYPRYAGVIMGISNTIGTVPGIVSPLIASSLLQSGKSGKDRHRHHPSDPFPFSSLQPEPRAMARARALIDRPRKEIDGALFALAVLSLLCSVVLCQPPPQKKAAARRTMIPRPNCPQTVSRRGT